jgi:hypothetical protein
MNWFRTHIRPGSRLALIALALQLALSFGHFHGVDTPSTAVAQAGSAIGPVQPAPDRDNDAADDLCAICVATAMAGTALVAAPPALPLPQAVEFHRLAVAAGRAETNPARRAFQPRAPPAS